MFNLEYQDILNNIQTWGYPLMFLFMIIEGPIATLGAAFMASLGFFNVFTVLGLSVVGDVIGDIILYYTGFFIKKGIIPKKRKFLKSNKGVIKDIKNSFETKGAQIILFTKITTGLCYITFIIAGMTKLSFKKFLIYSVLGGIIWSSFVVILGYYFGQLAEEIERYIKYSGWFVFGIAILLIASVVTYKRSLVNLKK